MTLFGQGCTLSGPLAETALKSIHSISPDQLAPVENSAEARRALGLLRKADALPDALDLYRQRATRRIEAQLAFFDGLAAARKAGDTAPLLAATGKHLESDQAKELASRVKSLQGEAPVAAWTSSVVQQLRDWYFDAIERDPEEDFHRAISSLKVNYSCSYIEEEDSADDDGGDDTASAAPAAPVKAKRAAKPAQSSPKQLGGSRSR